MLSAELLADFLLALFSVGAMIVRLTLFSSPEVEVDEDIEAEDCCESGLGGSVAAADPEATNGLWWSSSLISPKSMTRRSCGDA